MIKKSYITDFLAFIISVSSFILGFYSCKYNQDFHHWGIQISYLNDFKNGFSFFNEIYLQYGPGQVLLLFFLDKILEINFFTIGIVIQVIYSLNLFFLYKVFSIIVKKKFALLILFILYIIHPYAIYPWPDYISGLSLTLASYFLLKHKYNKNNNYILCGLFLFLAIFFRTSYLITVVPTFIFCFIFFRKIFYKERINVLILYFSFFLFSYFLFINKNLYFWYYQGLGSITTYAYGSNHYLMSSIIENYGENVWIFLKLIKMFLRFLYKLFNIFKLNNLLFSIFLILNLIYLLYFLLKNKIKNLNSLDNKLIFLSILGFFGFLQSFMIYETFRNINASIGIFFLGVHLIKKINFSKKNFLLFKVATLLFIIILLQKFPNISNYNKLVLSNQGNYVQSSINYFPKDSLLISENNDYYKNLNDNICYYDKKIINLSADFLAPYICSKNNKKFSAMGGFLAKTNPEDYKRIIEKNILFDDELLITSKNINSLNIKKVFEINLPSNLEWFSMYDNYSKKIFGYIKF